MTVTRPDDLTTVRFLIDQEIYTTEARRGPIVHQAFHSALPVKYTAGCRLTFQSPNGDEIFADNFMGQLADYFGTTDIVTSSQPIAGTEGSWKRRI